MTAASPAAPLARQLNLRDGMRVWFDAMPEEVFDEIAEYALDLTFVADPAAGVDAAHVFVAERAVLGARLATLRRQIAPDGHLWVSWPAPASAMPTDISADAVRELGLTLGLIDTRACAVAVHWAGLKLVIRKDLR